MPDTSTPSLPSIPAAALLGLRDGADVETWGRIRAGLIHAARHFALFLLAANLIGAAFVTMLFARFVPLVPLAGWATTLAIVAVGVAVRRLRGTASHDDHATPHDLRGTAWEGLMLALAWSAAPLLFGDAGDTAATLGMWVVLAVLMTGTAMAMAPLLLSTLSLLAAVTIAAVVPLALRGGHVAAAAATLFVALLAIAAIGRARTLAQMSAAAASLRDRDATVSLLLGESGHQGDDPSAGWLWETDATRRIVAASPRFALVCGVAAEALEGQPLLPVLAGPTWDSGDVAPGLRQVAERMKSRTGFRDIALPVTIRGEERWWSLTAAPRVDAEGRFAGFRGVGTDITEQRAASDRQHRLARHDTLTGLPNRLHVADALSAALAEARKWNARCAVLTIDLDRFATVNDTFGHPVGDRLLGIVARRLVEAAEGETVGRLDGDTFALVLRDGDGAAKIERLARSIIDRLAQPCDVDGHTLTIGASIGTATFPRDGGSAEALLHAADLALGRAKARGRGVVQAFEPGIQAEADRRRVLTAALHEALEKGELHLHYQPIVDAPGGTLCGFEALLRWHHPMLGTIPPATFIPIAQETRLIAPIGDWVLRTACAEAAGWPGALRLSVNVAAEQLQQPQFLGIVASALGHSGLAPARLDLEMTEGVYLRSGIAASDMPDRLRALGVGLSLDDFGTGASALGYLGQARFASVKIDRSFVSRAAEGAGDAVAIIRAVVAMAESLGMATIAEGVETDAELRTIRDLGCSHVQGHYFGRPLPADEARTIAARAATRAA